MVDDLRDPFGGSLARTAAGPRGAIAQSGWALQTVAPHPLGDGLGSDLEAGRGPLQGHASGHALHQLFSTAQGKSGILVDNHSVGPPKLDCSSQPASLFPTEWTTS